jgi:phenylacetate-coenzyme A ligase PaaK-like adenylate-forming protein
MYSNILKYAILPIADISMNTSISSSYRRIKNLEKYSPRAITEWQNEQLRRLLHHAFDHTSYYREVFLNAGLRPDDVRSINDLNKLPVLTKQDIRGKFKDMVASNITSIPHQKSSTGGSTGDPLVYLLDHGSWSFTTANTIVNWERIGYRYGDLFIALGSTSLYVNKSPSIKHKIYYRLKNKIGLNGINMSDEVCRDYIKLIKEKRIRFIYGYASSIYLLAKYAKEHNQKLDLCACFPTSEVLRDTFRDTIQESFGCEIIDSYGANDGGVSAFAHKKGFFEVGYNCLVRVENPDKNGTGPALLTDLFNYAMPLINYKLGDDIQIREIKDRKYDYNGQIVNKVLGRTSDIIQLGNGRSLTGPGFTILFKNLPVEYYCIEKNGKNSVKCSIVKLSGFGKAHEDLIKETFYKQIGKDAKFAIEYTNTIPTTKTGKRAYFKN